MNHHLAHRSAISPVRRLDAPTGLELLEGQRAGPVVLFSQELERLDDLGILAQAKKILGRLAQTDDGDAQDGQDEDKSTAGEQDIPPTPVVIAGAGLGVGAVPLLGGHEAPGDEAGDGLSNSPPASKQGQEPLLLTGEELEKDGGVHDEIAAAAKTEQGDEETKRRPVGHGASDDAARRADQEGDVEGVLSADDVGTKAPEDGTGQHAHVGGNGEAVHIALSSEFLERLIRNDGLKEEDQRIHGIATTHRVSVTDGVTQWFKDVQSLTRTR